MTDMAFCDSKSDNAKDADVVQLTPEQESSIADRAKTIGIKAGLEWAFGNLYLLNRPNAKRVLAACPGERGYAIFPYIQLGVPR